MWLAPNRVSADLFFLEYPMCNQHKYSHLNKAEYKRNREFRIADLVRRSSPDRAVSLFSLATLTRLRHFIAFVASASEGGGGGIRTPEGFYTLPVFKTGAINRSTTPPEFS